MYVCMRMHKYTFVRETEVSITLCVCVCVCVYVIVSCLNSAHMTCQGLYANDVLDVLYSSIFVFMKKNAHLALQPQLSKVA